MSKFKIGDMVIISFRGRMYPGVVVDKRSWGERDEYQVKTNSTSGNLWYREEELSTSRKVERLYEMPNMQAHTGQR